MQNLPKYINAYPHLTDIERVELACDYLVHEFRKIFPDMNKDEAYKAIKRYAPTKDSTDETIRDFWNLFSAMSDGWRLKALHNIVTAENITWSKENISLRLLKPSDPHGWMKELVPRGCTNSYDFQALVSYWQKNESILNEALEESKRERKKRAEGDENDPVIARRVNNLFCVVDGSSRIKVAIENWVKKGGTYKPPKITIWIGWSKAPKGISWTPTSSLFFLKTICGNDPEIIAERISPLAKMEYIKRVK